ncbi:MAG: ferritin [Deltaproteobacteria bacterium]|nr:ferritin [Deltaproteobacteria bacterium]MBN2672526.1 ferritin [Deltaproteobacteria bacterium]
MIKQTVQDALNEQINAEIYSSYMYYAMASYFDSISLDGFSHWLRVQALEELTHVQKIAGYLNERGGRVNMKAVEAPPNEWDSPLACFEAVYAHECKVTELINSLMDLALAERDHATVSFLNWFVDEQTEEESNTDAVVQKLKLVDGNKGGLFMLDREMDARTFVLPAELTGVF